MATITKNMHEALSLLNTLQGNANQEQITTAARSLRGLDAVPADKWYGWHQREANISASDVGVTSWVSDEMNKIARGLWATKRWDMLKSDAARTLCHLIVDKACWAMLEAGVSGEKGESQKASEAAFAACGGWVSSI